MSGQFQAATTADLQTIRAKRAEAEAELLALSRQVRPAALRLSLGNPEPEDEQIVTRHRDAQHRVETLALAEEAAEAAERDRVAARYVADDGARRKAVAAHIGRALSALDKSSSAIQAAIAAYADAIEAVRAADAASPGDIRAAGFLQHAFAPGRIGRLWICELARLAEERGIEYALFKHAPYVADLRDNSGRLRSLHEILAPAIDRLKSDLRDGAARVVERHSAAVTFPAAAQEAGVHSRAGSPAKHTKIEVAA